MKQVGRNEEERKERGTGKERGVMEEGRKEGRRKERAKKEE